jgi:hypothetical protein
MSKLKIIISHDVDHLYASDHIFKDLIIPKLWIRSFFELLKNVISLKCFFYRVISIFDKRWNRIPEVIVFDSSRNIPATFFFGMANKLGLSYSIKKAKIWINYVVEKKFDVGVHGIDFENPEKEYKLFKNLFGLDNFGIRMHYVRYNSKTFAKLAKCGYLFDSSEFNKQKIHLQDPYKIDTLWEFPLQIMDGYILKNGLTDAKNLTIQVLQEAEGSGLNYFSFLFHDYLYNEKTYPLYKEYYEWFVSFCESRNYSFISYLSAIKELNDR